ncbi:hypothetical protein AB0B50_00325 [Streptomyces sp. NPDC041068]|uniref:Acg family FMN-binding oxidoreductase n=1 Tax=Streptomyces sp. NPDC041068 TaxID=3155130 RepID=UPI0034052AE2
MSVSAQPGHAAHHLVRAAVTAPSIHNTQPWFFVGDEQDRALELHADIGRRLPLADPDGRELVISCGAALFNVRLAVRHLGFTPRVEYFPRPWDTSCLARVTWGSYSAPTGDEARLHAALARRRTVRGPLRPDPLPPPLVDALCGHARAEGATLYAVQFRDDRQRLADVVRTAEAIHRTDLGHVVELARWTYSADQERLDGVPETACAYHPDYTPYAGRDYTGITRTIPAPPWSLASRTGLVVVLATPHDHRVNWLCAGQALQRVLLCAADQRVMAAFHTQPLEVPRMRAQIRRTITADAYPQMILRLGLALRDGHLPDLPRRPPDQVLSLLGPVRRTGTGSRKCLGKEPSLLARQEP